MTPELDAKRKTQCCASCVFGKKMCNRGFENYYYAIRCKISGDVVTDDWYCNAYEGVAG